MKGCILRFGYEGWRFQCFHREDGKKSVLGTLAEALVGVGMGSDVDLKAASRTDRGVSAMGNVAFFSVPPNVHIPGALRHAARHLLSQGMYLHSYTMVEEDFSVRHNVVERIYTYYLPMGLLAQGNIEGLEEALALFSGRHDFSAFSKPDKGRVPDPKIDLDISLSRIEGAVVLRFRAKHFMWHMIRKIVWAMVEVSEGRIDPAVVKNLLDGEKGRKNIGLAPPQFLVLDWVRMVEPLESSFQRLSVKGMKDAMVHNIDDAVARANILRKMYGEYIAPGKSSDAPD